MRSFRKSSVQGVATCVVGASLLATSCLADHGITIGSKGSARRPVLVESIDHSAWDALLKRYVDENGMVDYAAWKSSAPDLEALDAYLAHLSQATFSQSSSADARLAYWINAYNALTIKGILREYPTTSIRNHTPKLAGYNIWKDLRLLVAGNGYSLEQIEHEMLRKLDEPRIHFAIVCASIGCPRLLNEAYVADRLEEQLSANAKAFFADRTKFQYDGARRTIAVSPILKWFAEDFGSTQADQFRTIAPYFPDTASRRLAESGSARISYLNYDWGLNDQSSAPPILNR